MIRYALAVLVAGGLTLGASLAGLLAVFLWHVAVEWGKSACRWVLRVVRVLAGIYDRPRSTSHRQNLG